MFGFGALAVALLSFQPSDLSGSTPEVLPIVGGDEATSCQFPSVVSILEDDETPSMCSGTLVHPNVVTLAAHCVNPERPIIGVGFGEEGQGDTGPVRTIGVEDCVGHPQYFSSGYPDIAYCTLAEPVTDVPRVPILAGCELDVLEPGLEVTIVGYGASYGNVDSGEVEAEGVGPKRYTTQTIDEVEADRDEVHMVGPNGSQSACFGDSGGPSFVEMSDGTWRVFGAASRLYDPGGFPPPKLPGNFCGVGVTYGLLTTQLEWLETQTGYDLTPCHDESGEWDPSESCGDFPLSPNVGVGTWEAGCAGGGLGGGEPLCEPAMGGSTGGDDTTTGDPDGTSTGAVGDGSSTGGLSGGTGGSTAGESGPISDESSTTDAGGGVTVTATSPEPETTNDGSSSGGASSDDGDADGCGCRSGSPRGAVLFLGLGLLGLRRRR